MKLNIPKQKNIFFQLYLNSLDIININIILIPDEILKFVSVIFMNFSSFNYSL